MGEAARGEPRLPGAMGADLAGRRPDQDVLPPAHPALPARDPERHRLPFFIFSPDGETLLGGLTLAQVQRGVTQSAVLGYWMGAPYAGKGLMTAAVRAVDRLCLRLAAPATASRPPACRTTRPRSASLKRSDFGARATPAEYLCIDGRWQDHSFTAWSATIRGADLPGRGRSACLRLADAKYYSRHRFVFRFGG